MLLNTVFFLFSYSPGRITGKKLNDINQPKYVRYIISDENCHTPGCWEIFPLCLDINLYVFS